MTNRLNLPALLPLFVALTAATACSGPADEQRERGREPAAGDTQQASDVDYHSFANVADYRIRHLDLEFDIDFARKVIDGVATLDLERLNDAGRPLILDTRQLDIRAVRAGREGNLEVVPFAIGEPVEILGAPLEIELPPDATSVEIRYATSPSASGLQWLEPLQTRGKRHPFLFSQAQAIHARSFVPLQDTPAVRMTYDAVVRVPQGLRAVMSADNDPAAEENGVFTFSMPQRIPSYLLALAVGDLDFRSMGPRTGVYAEQEILDAAAAEFEDTEAMLETTEEIYGPYRWDRYDLLILPPSFPFGGMENPRLSFITPTVIAGDKSLVALIAHELAHSWSGNLVTNASWRDLWLNEGFTTYLTYRIMQVVYGDGRYRMEMALGYADLQEDLAKLEPADQRLAIDLRGRDPDEVFSNVPYEKGALFLYEIEQRIGRDAFDRFLLEYFNEFAFESVSTADFLDYVEDTLLARYPESLDMGRLRQWIHEPGIPDGAPRPRSDAFAAIDDVRSRWLEDRVTAARIDTGAWTYHEWKHFLDGMPESLSRQQLDDLDGAFGLTESRNNEIAFSWLRIAIRNDYEPAYGRLEAFLTGIGRNKFLRPLYQALMDSGRADMAARIFEEARPGYHPLTVKRNALIVYPEDAGSP